MNEAISEFALLGFFLQQKKTNGATPAIRYKAGEALKYLRSAESNMKRARQLAKGLKA